MRNVKEELGIGLKMVGLGELGYLLFFHVCSFLVIFTVFCNRKGG